MRLSWIATCLLLATTLVGCGGPVSYVDVNAIAAPGVGHLKTYVVVSGKRDLPTSDLQFREYEVFIHRAMQHRGFTKADSEENADLAIFVNYDVSDPKYYTYAYSIPIYGQTGGGITYHSGTISGSAGTANFSGSSYQPPQYGVVSTSTHVGQREYYVLSLRLDAVNLKEYRLTQRLDTAWRVSAVCKHIGNDMRLNFPYLVAGCLDYLGQNTKRTIELDFFENDPRIGLVRGTSPK